MRNILFYKICLLVIISTFHSLYSLAQPGDNGSVIIIQGAGLREVSPASRLNSSPQ